MTWIDFSTLVRTYLHVHNRRQGVQTLIDTLIQAAMLDLQSSIPEVRFRTTTVFSVPDLSNAFVSTDGGFFFTFGAPSTPADSTAYAQTGSLPRNSKVVRVYARKADDHTQTDDYEFYDIRNIDKMQTGSVAQNPRLFVHDPVNARFFITPKLDDDGSELVVIHEGVKYEFSAEDEISLPADAAMTVSHFVLTKLTMDVDRDPQTASAHRQMYLAGKRRLLSDIRESQLPPVSA